MNYTAMYKSSEIIGDIDSINKIIKQTEIPEDEPKDDPSCAVPKWNIDGQFMKKDESAWFVGGNTTFDVWNSDSSENVTIEFLEKISQYLEEPLIIRSVGFTGRRHIPDAHQYNVYPNGNISEETLSEVSEV